MKLKFTELEEKVHLNIFLVTVRYAHGDADLRTEEVHVMSDIHDNDQLIKWIDCFNIAAKQIRDNRYCCKKLSANFEEDCGYTNVHVERDRIFTGSVNYADMRIIKIEYIDNQGEKFLVELVNE